MSILIPEEFHYAICMGFLETGFGFSFDFWECSIPAANQEESELVLYVFDIIVSLWIKFLVKKLHLII